MKTISIIAAVLLIAASAGAVLPLITDFTVRVQDQTAVLEWTSGMEAGVVSFRVERSFDGVQFHEIATQEPLGNRHNYRYIDRDLFKGQPHVYYYRIVAVLSNNQTWTSLVQRVTIDASGVTRTWGSLKAMFR